MLVSSVTWKRMTQKVVREHAKYNAGVPDAVSRGKQGRFGVTALSSVGKKIIRKSGDELHTVYKRRIQTDPPG